MQDMDELPQVIIPEEAAIGKPAGSAVVNNDAKLDGGLEYFFFYRTYIENVTIPTDELIFFRGVRIPPTR